MVNYRLPASQPEVDDILDIEGVVSVGEGLEGGEKVMVVGVNDPALQNSAEIPGTLGGLPVVIEVENNPGLASAGNPLAPPGDIPTPVDGAFIEKVRPVPPGVSIGHKDVTAGTSSFIATDGDKLYQLSNNHVLALRNDAQPGDSILQPGAADSGSDPEDRVGALEDYVELTDIENLVDIAWYSPETDITGKIMQLDPPESGTLDPELGDEITFIGRTSGVTTATVDRAHAVIEVGEDRRRFVDQFRLDKPLRGGDSGAPIVIESGGGYIPAGIGYASTEDNGWAMYASNVEAETGLTLVAAEPQDDSAQNGQGALPLRADIDLSSKEAAAIATALGAGLTYLGQRD